MQNYPRNVDWRFSHDVTKIQSRKLLILLRFYFHDVKEQLKTSIIYSYKFSLRMGPTLEFLSFCVTRHFTWRSRELSRWLKKRLISANLAIWTVHVLEKVIPLDVMFCGFDVVGNGCTLPRDGLRVTSPKTLCAGGYNGRGIVIFSEGLKVFGFTIMKPSFSLTNVKQSQQFAL